MARPSNAEYLRKLMHAYGLKRPAVLDIVRQAGYNIAKITLDAYLSRDDSELYRPTPEHVLKAVQEWCEKHGKRKKD